MSLLAVVEEKKEMKFRTLTPFREVAGVGVDEQAGTARVVIITQGLGNLRDRNYYSRAAVESCVKVFEGKQFYIDHPGRDDEENRPERTMRDLAGYFFDCALGEVADAETGERLAACFASLKFSIETEPGRLAFGQVKHALEYQRRYQNTKDVYCGISINGGGVSHPDEIGGLPVNMVTEIREAFSADIVTKPARGGKFLSVFAEAEAAKDFRRQIALGVSPTAAAKRSEEKYMDKMTEARRMVADEAKKRMLSGEGLKGIGDKIGRVVTAINEPPDNPDDLIADIQGDLDALLSLLDDLKGSRKAAVAAEKEARVMKKQAEKEAAKAAENEKTAAKADETEAKYASEDEKKAAEAKAAEAKAAEAKAAEAEDEDEDEDEDESKSDEAEKKEGEGDEEEAEGKATENGDKPYGHVEPDGDEDGDDDDDDDDGDEFGEKPQKNMGMRPESENEARMTYTCASCAAENEVVAPKGYRLVAAEGGYATESERARQNLVVRLRRQLEAKEARMLKANEKTRGLMQELIQLRAENTAFKRTIEARKMLKEAGIPRDVLAAKDLLAFEPNQWESQIKAAKHTLSKEAALVNKGGNPVKDAGIKTKEAEARGADAAIRIFQESAGLKK